MNIVDSIAEEINPLNKIPDFTSGDTLTVYYKIKEGNKERIQFFKERCYWNALHRTHIFRGNTQFVH